MSKHFSDSCSINNRNFVKQHVISSPQSALGCLIKPKFSKTTKYLTALTCLVTQNNYNELPHLSMNYTITHIDTVTDKERYIFLQSLPPPNMGHFPLIFIEFSSISSLHLFFLLSCFFFLKYS